MVRKKIYVHSTRPTPTIIMFHNLQALHLFASHSENSSHRKQLSRFHHLPCQTSEAATQMDLPPLDWWQRSTGNIHVKLISTSILWKTQPNLHSSSQKKTTDISAAALQLHVQIYIISSPLCLQLATSAASDQKESSQLPMTNIKSPFSASRCPQVNLTSSRMIHSRPSNSKNALEVYSTL